MFGISRIADLPTEAQTQQEPWDRIVSEIWRAALKCLDIHACRTMIEIGPGTSAKVANAFACLDYRGHICILDASSNAISVMREKYQQACPGAVIQTIEGRLNKTFHLLPENLDIVIMSHIIDDMMLWEAALHFPGKQNAFEWHGGSSYQMAPTLSFHDLWQHVEMNPSLLAKVKQEVFLTLSRLIKKISAKKILMSQYPSATLQENGLDAVNKHASDIFQELKKEISQLQGSHFNQQLQKSFDGMENYHHHHIGNHILNAEHWIIFEALV